jgi:hypothetical protein
VVRRNPNTTNSLKAIITHRNLITVVATRKANLPLNRHTATNSILLNSSSSSTKDSLLNSRNMVTTKDLPSQISTRDPVALLPLLLQHLSSSVMALPMVTTSDTQTAPAEEKPF